MGRVKSKQDEIDKLQKQIQDLVWSLDKKKLELVEEAKAEAEEIRRSGVLLKKAREDLAAAEDLQSRGWKVKPPTNQERPEYWDDCDTCGRTPILGGGECSRCRDGN